MSSFGGVRLPIRTHRRRNAASNSPPSSPKRKPFAPSSVSVDMSGPPPPLPPVAKAEVSQEKLADSSPGQSVTAQEFLDATFGMGLQIMSPRWLQLTAVLWSIFVVDANRSVDRAALRNFLDAIEWRISGQITEQEFLSLYSEWMAANYAPLKRRSSIGINQLRHLLLGKSCGEGELDLILGALLFENSRSLLNRPLSFSDGAMTKAARNALDICSRRWLALAEELFFALDAPGYGCLQYDQVFFFAACLVLGLRSWSDSTEVESDLSIGVLTAITANIIKDACYAHTGGLNAANALNLSAQEEGAAGGSSAPLTPGRRGAIAPENATVTSGGNNFGEGVWSGYNPSTNNTAATWCVGMTMPIFKSYLIKMGIGETVLMTLLEHVRDTLAVITSRLSSWSDTSSSERPAAAALQACVPVELAGKGWRVARDGVAAPPLLWQSTLLRVSGWVSGREPLDHEDLHGASDQPIVYSQISRPLQSKDGSDYNEHSLSSINRLKDSEWLGVVSQINENDDPLPPILSFLMSDGDNLVPMALRAYGDTIMAFDALNASPEVAGMQVLHNTVWKLVRAFKKWGQVGGTTPLNIDFQVQGIPSVDLRKDPIYQFILTAITEYKKLQLCLCSAFSDVALSGSGGIVKDDYSSDKLAQSSSVVALACAALLPRGEIILNEFQAYEKIINTGSPTSKPFISVKRNSMIKSRGSKWEAFAMDVKTTPEKVPTGAIEIEAEAEAVDQADDAEKPPSPTAPLLARRAPPHRRASAPVISSTQSLDFIKRSDGLQLIRAKDDGDARAKDIPNKKPFSSLSGLFTEVSVDSASAVAGEGNNPGVQAPTVHATSAAAVASSSYEDVLKYIEESSPNWTPADANLIAGAKWKSVRGDTSPADGESTTRGASADSSTRSNFSAEADKLQRKIVDLILASNPEVSIEQREHLKGIVAQSMPPVEHGRDAQQSSQKSKRSAAVTRLEDELKAEQSYAIREDNIGKNAYENVSSLLM